jgi:hypothetical protein
MAERGRIDGQTQISPDRSVWFPLERLGNEFASPPSRQEALVSPEHQAFGETGRTYFRNVDGVMRGPFSLTELQSDAVTGALNPNDLLWTEGQSAWNAAGTVAGLSFPSTRRRVGSWVNSHPAVLTSLVLGIVLLIGLPIYVAIASSRARERQAAAEADRVKAAAARLDRDRTELFEQQRFLQQQELAAQSRREQLMLQYAQISEDNSYRSEVRKRLDEVDSQLAGFNRQQAAILAAIEANSRERAKTDDGLLP